MVIILMIHPCFPNSSPLRQKCEDMKAVHGPCTQNWHPGDADIPTLANLTHPSHYSFSNQLQ